MGAVRRRLVLWFSILASLYVVLVLVLALCQDTLVFPGAGRGVRELPADLHGVEQGRLVRPDGGEFRIAIAASVGPARAVAVYFVGNGEDLQSAAYGAAMLAQYGLVVIGVEHPGYGSSQGPPSVATLLGSAEVAAQFGRSKAQQLGVPLVAIGSSLGTFCAVHLASRQLVDRMLLRAPPTSMLAAAQRQFWWLPVRLLLRHRFDNLAVAPQVRCPVLVLHGDRDHVVPLDLGQQLCAAFAGEKQLIVAHGCDHNDLPLERSGPYGQQIAAFLGAR
jgi:pimeloyl-ACP methyl ester carboxylesterase